jgi:hypothetical protein
VVSLIRRFSNPWWHPVLVNNRYDQRNIMIAGAKERLAFRTGSCRSELGTPAFIHAVEPVGQGQPVLDPAEVKEWSPGLTSNCGR